MLCRHTTRVTLNVRALIVRGYEPQVKLVIALQFLLVPLYVSSSGEVGCVNSSGPVRATVGRPNRFRPAPRSSGRTAKRLLSHYCAFPANTNSTATALSCPSRPLAVVWSRSQTPIFGNVLKRSLLSDLQAG